MGFNCGGWAGFPLGDAFATVATATNVVTETNPAYTPQDFYAFYPDFQNANIPDSVIESFIALATSIVIQAQWGPSWLFGMANFIAHFVTLYQRAAIPPSATAAQVAQAGAPVGIQSSKSVGGVSVSYDFSAITGALSGGWASYGNTQYGVLFAQFAKLNSMGGIYAF